MRAHGAAPELATRDTADINEGTGDSISLLAHIDDELVMCAWVYEHRAAVIAGMSVETALPWLQEVQQLERALRGKRQHAARRAARVLECAIGARLNEADEVAA